MFSFYIFKLQSKCSHFRRFHGPSTVLLLLHELKRFPSKLDETKVQKLKLLIRQACKLVLKRCACSKLSDFHNFIITSQSHVSIGSTCTCSISSNRESTALAMYNTIIYKSSLFVKIQMQLKKLKEGPAVSQVTSSEMLRKALKERQVQRNGRLTTSHVLYKLFVVSKSCLFFNLD